ncbi:MAG: CheR family methyltransferase [Candidatus Sericytochromatia bacterium]
MTSIPLHVIGIGASAGGLEAIRTVLAHLDQGLETAAIILAQHLSPHHSSKLTEILSHQDKIRVLEACHDQEIEANTLYVTPQDREITVIGNHIRLAKPTAGTGSIPSIDVLFHSLAQEKQELAVGVILSGHGSDGAAGMLAIHLAGGITLAQDPDSAQSASMPMAAIAGGCVDRILLPEQIGAALNGLVRAAPEIEPASERQALQKVLLHLSTHSGIDFSNYKLPTLFRRFQKRLAQLDLPDAEAYLSWLETHPDEPEQLFKLMLIGVTRFFRDPEAFARLESLLAELVAAKAHKDPIRVWVPGCATGEEAYTLAFILCRLMQEKWHDCNLQIFASDLDEAAIAFARKGLYPASALEDLPADVISRCFVKQGDAYQVTADIRSRILFTRHDVAGNPPFLKLDLISCRNLLIYFNASLQKQLMPIFHYALNPNGCLFLGKSESIGEFGDLFEMIDSESKLFRRKQGNLLRTIRFSAFKPQRSLQIELPLVQKQGAPSLGTLVKETLFASFEYPYAVINDSLDVQEVCGDARLYLGVGEGQLTTHILRLIQAELQVELMAVISRTQRERVPLRSPICRFEFLGLTHYVRFSVKPLLFTTRGQDLYLVVFEPIDPAEQWLPKPAGESDSGADNAELRHELETVRIQLQNYIEELETSNEEHQTLNEELMSTNEELQSSNEELETSNEELHSTYEEVQAAYVELHATNQALEVTQSELKKAEANVWALLNNTLQAFVLADPFGNIVSFNQEAQGLFLRLSGKQLAPGLALASCFTAENQTFFLGELSQAFEAEFRSGEKLVQSYDGKPCWLAYNFTPVQAPDKSLQAVSISFLDISVRILAQEKLRAQDQRFKSMIENSFDGIVICDKYGLFIYVSPSIERMLGFETHEMIHHHSSEFIHPEDLGKMGQLFSRLVAGPEQASQIQWRQRHKDGAWRWLEGVGINSFELPEIGGTIINFRDITERRLHEEALRLSEARLRQVIDLIPAYIYARDSQNRCLLANVITARLFRLTPHDLEGRCFDDLQGKLPENSASLLADQEVRDQSVIRILPEISFDAGPNQIQYLRSFKIPYTASDSGNPATLTVAMDISGFKLGNVKG